MKEVTVMRKPVYPMLLCIDSINFSEREVINNG